MNVKAFESLDKLNKYLEDQVESAGSIPEGIEPPIPEGFLEDPQSTCMWTVESKCLDRLDEFESVKVFAIDRSHYTGEGGCYENIRTYILVDAR